MAGSSKEGEDANVLNSTPHPNTVVKRYGGGYGGVYNQVTPLHSPHHFLVLHAIFINRKCKCAFAKYSCAHRYQPFTIVHMTQVSCEFCAAATI